jgi:hypothetical protein
MQAALSLFAFVYIAVTLIAIGWAFYLAYLATLALRKYLRS